MDEVMVWIVSLVLVFSITASSCDISVEKATLAQEICIKANSKAISFDRTEVTCENNAVIPLKKEQQ